MTPNNNTILYVSNHQLSPYGGVGGGSPSCCTIGSFDGVHQGHKFVVSQVMEQAKKRGLTSLVVTFSNHPLKVLRPDFRPQLLTLEDEKVELLKETGVDGIALLEFTKELSQLSAREFMQKILKEQLNAKVLIIGYDNHFGHDHKTFDDYVEYGKELGIEVIKNTELPSDFKASSTAVRNALNQGDILAANKILGYPYYIKGKVVNGFHIGRKIGFPTANIEVPSDKLIPMDGVYCVKALDHIGMMNIGYRPTLDNGPQRSLEVHLLDFDGNLYGDEIKIEFLKFLRGEKKFDSIEQLQQQLKLDEMECRKL